MLSTPLLLGPQPDAGAAFVRLRIRINKLNANRIKGPAQLMQCRQFRIGNPVFKIPLSRGPGDATAASSLHVPTDSRPRNAGRRQRSRSRPMDGVRCLKMGAIRARSGAVSCGRVARSLYPACQPKQRASLNHEEPSTDASPREGRVSTSDEAWCVVLRRVSAGDKSRSSETRMTHGYRSASAR
jgi:hypothetical protein